MSSKPVKILLTGLPGCGKTTVVINVLENLKGIKTAGFYTQEIREDNIRKGFSFNRLDGQVGILAHTEIKGPYRVGKYGVNLEEFEKSIVPILNPKETDAELFVIDEIGKMECMCAKFIEAVRRLFRSDKAILATVALKGTALISEIKKYPGIKLYNLTAQNRDKTTAEILRILSVLKKTS